MMNTEPLQAQSHKEGTIKFKKPTLNLKKSGLLRTQLDKISKAEPTAASSNSFRKPVVISNMIREKPSTQGDTTFHSCYENPLGR
jgi:hypothetical protein